MCKVYVTIQGLAAAAIAWVGAKLGILFPVLGVLLILMIVDYLTGMAASKIEAIDHPDDASYGWSSKKGAKGILKKVAYMCVIAGAVVLDYIITVLGAELGIDIKVKAFFGLLVAIWYVLNELLSIVENAGRMGAGVPEWLLKYIAALKSKVDSKGDQEG